MKKLSKFYRILIIILALASLIFLFYSYPLKSSFNLSLAEKILWLGVLVIAFGLGWKALPTGQIRAVDAVYYSLIILFNPLAFSSLVVLSESQRYFYAPKKTHKKNIPFEISQTLLTLIPASVIYYKLSPQDMLSRHWYDLCQNLIIFTLAVLISFLIKSLFENIDKIMQKNYPITYLNNLHPVKTKIYIGILAPMGLGTAVLFKLNPIAWLLFLLPWIIIINTLNKYLNLVDESQMALKYIAEISDVKNNHNKYHSLKVAQYSKKIALQLKLNEQTVQEITQSAVLHDLGIISISDDVLNKKEAPLRKEQTQVKKHPLMGAYIVNHFDFMHNIASNIKHQNENYNGTGYPDNLKGEKIPLGARIIAVAEEFQNAVYDKNFSKDNILNQIKSNQNIKFDPRVVEAFEKVLNEKN